MYILKQFQETAVKALLTHTYEALQETGEQIPVLLEAPTGAGKTVMMASYLERLSEELPLQPGLQHHNIAFIWFAPNTLHIQSFQSLQRLYADNSKLNCIDLNDLSNNPSLNCKDLLFVNWSSVDGLKKIWRRENEQNTNLETLVENTMMEGTQIILIIDEAHLSAFSGPQAIAVRHLIKAKIEVLVTATPQNRPARNVVIQRQTVINEQMIKKGVRMNIGIDPEQQNGENVHIHLLRKAFEKKKELEQLYSKELGESKLNPLLLIQLPSENSALSEQDKTIRDTLEGLLANEYGITTSNGRLAIWLSGERLKDGLEEPNALQDVLIFKQAIAQGWDCPRAAVLVSYRQVQSTEFGIQTVGRILRMPHQRHYSHDDLNYGYVYTNIESNRVSFVPSDADYFNMQYAVRKSKPGWVYNQLKTASIVNDRPTPGVLTSVFQLKFFEVIEKRFGVSQLPDVDLFTPQDQATYKKQIESNRQKLRENGWEFDIDEHQIHIPSDIEVDPYEVDTIVLTANQIRDFAITTAEFKTMFERFCYDNITRLNRSKSWKKLAETLRNFAEYYLNMFETDAWKFFLYPQNRALLVPMISKALERFEAWQKEKGNARRRVENSNWTIPEVRFYSDRYKREEIDAHALEPFFEFDKASSVEKVFKEYLKQCESQIEWWYKNGDQGQENFAIPYRNLQDELRLFYVDFVIKFKSGKIGLFDTKTKRSDADAPKKHNALVEYMENENSKNAEQILIGGVLIPEDIGGVVSFRYCSNRISDTNDLTGWDYLDPAIINEN